MRTLMSVTNTIVSLFPSNPTWANFSGFLAAFFGLIGNASSVTYITCPIFDPTGQVRSSGSMFPASWFKRNGTGYDWGNISSALYLGVPDLAQYRLFLLSAQKPSVISFGARGITTGRVGMMLDRAVQDGQVYWYDNGTPKSLQNHPSGFLVYNDKLMGLQWRGENGLPDWTPPDALFGPVVDH